MSAATRGLGGDRVITGAADKWAQGQEKDRQSPVNVQSADCEAVSARRNRGLGRPRSASTDQEAQPARQALMVTRPSQRLISPGFSHKWTTELSSHSLVKVE